MNLLACRETAVWAGVGLVLHLAYGSLAARPQVDLTGAWDFYADVGDADLARVTAKPGRIIVPGAWQAQGYGAPGGTIPSSVVGSDISKADYLRHNLLARCLYVRAVNVPAEWRGQRVFWCVRRVYRYADLTVNGQRVGDYEGFCSPFEFDVTDAVQFGATNQFVLGIDNRPRAGRDTVGTANYFGNWGGIGGAVYLEVRPPVYIEDVFAMPKVRESRVVLRIRLRTDSKALARNFTLEAKLEPDGGATIAGAPPAARATRSLAAGDAGGLGEAGHIDLPVDIPNARLWTPESPSLYVAQVRLLRDGRPLDELSVRFGLREISAEGRKLFLNGKPLYLSGYGDDATEPITGMLPNDKVLYRQRLQLTRSLGFNFVRHHSCIPHDEYLEAADEVGVLVQPEAGMAYVKYWPKAHQLFTREWPRIVRALRNHPSIWAWCMGNELFLNDLSERDTNALALDLSKPIRSGPLQTVANEENGVFGPPGQFPTQSFKQSNYYRDLELAVDGARHTLFANAQTSRVFTDGPHELGLKFISTRAAQITTIRYYRVASEKGTHVGHLWDGQRRELVRVEFTGETDSGWQEAKLSAPVHLEANQKYLVSVNANKAYAATPAQTGEGVSRQDILAVVAQAYRQAKELDPTRLVHASDGGHPQTFSDVYSSGAAERFGPKPFLLHEYGTYTCSLPDFSLIPRLNGVIRPATYERAERYVHERQLEGVYARLRRSSLCMRADAQKYYIEAAKAGDGNNGFSFWLGIDFPDSPEGCWDEGILNQLWEPKPYLTNGLPEIAGPTVLLCDAGLGARSFYNDTPKPVALRLWHYGTQPVANARLTWRVLEGDKVLQNGERSGIACGLGERIPAGEVVIDALTATVPRFVRLEVDLWQDQRRVTRNGWEFYAYPRVPHPAVLPGVYSEAGELPSAMTLSTNAPLPSDLRVVITCGLKRGRHGDLLRRGQAAVLLLGNGGFKETRAGYFLNQYGSGFGGIIEDHPVFAPIPHDGRLHLGLHQLIAGGGLLDAETMPAALREGAVVWGLKLTAWISPVKDLNKALHWSEAITDKKLHLVLCGLDLRSDKPESRYVLSRTLDYLLADQVSPIAKQCNSSGLDVLLR